MAMDAYYAGFIRRRDAELSHSNSVPSFSSSLLDSVYRSIQGGKEEPGVNNYRDTMRKKQGNHSNSGAGAGGRGPALKGRNAGGDDAEGFPRIERWTGEERAVARRNSAVEVDRKLSRMWNSSSSGSSDSSSGVFSSSELEPVSGVPAGPSCYGLNRGRPKPVRTGSEHQGKATKKSRARKISGDLRKGKQPVSPGGRLASFLNSLFVARKGKLSSVAGSDEDRRAKSLNASACSSASSYSRSCLSKSTAASTAGATITPSSAAKRSVRFYPVSVIVDEDNRPCGHKNLDVPVKTEKTRRAEASAAAAARDLLRTYQKRVEKEFGLTRSNNVVKNVKVYKEEDDDADSYASSDLFELENLSAVGMERYGEELPVYETTNLGTNRAIASGLIL